MAGDSGWMLWQDALAGDSGLLLAAPGSWFGCWRHLEGPGCRKWCHSQPKSTFQAKSIKKSTVFEGDMDLTDSLQQLSEVTWLRGG